MNSPVDICRDTQGGGSPEPAAATPRAVRVGSPSSLLAAIPALLGFHPAGSLVIIGAVPPRNAVALTLRYDLSGPSAAETAEDAAGILSDHDLITVMAVGYGPAALVTPAMTAFSEHAERAGLRVAEMLRAEHGLYWSYVCSSTECCPPEGTPYDPAGHPAAAALAGGARILASREEMAATIAPAQGQAAEDMLSATAAAGQRAAEIAGPEGLEGPAIGTVGAADIAAAIEAARRGAEDPQCDTAAWLTVILRNMRVRDDAWARMDPAHRAAHERLWAHLTRQAAPGYAAAPASLLAFTAWQSGNGALAHIALDRAQSDDPGYRLAQLLREAVSSGMPPTMPMTPDEVAASYGQPPAGSPA